MNNREYNAFIVNNKELLSSDINTFLQDSMNQALLRGQNKIEMKQYACPDTYEIKCDKRL